MIKRGVLAMIASLGLPACGLDKIVNPVVDSANNAVATLDGAIEQISAASGSWQTVLQSTVAQLTGDAQSTLRVEVQTLLDNSIAAVQVGVMCTVDFVGARVIGALEAIKAKLLGRPAPAPSPFVCSSAPSAVEFAAWQQSRVPIVTLTGFDLKTPLAVRLVQTTGTSAIPDVLAEVSPYQATINLGATGLRLTTASQRITVSTTSNPIVELTAINIIQPQPKICAERDLLVTPGPISFLPRDHTRGDTEFAGHGPHTTAHLDIYAVGTKLNYHVSMRAAETQSDHTTVTGTGGGELALTPPLPSGVRIVAINGPTASNADYTDQDHREDHVRPTNGGPIREFVFVGDTDGDDVGRTRMVSASFHPVGLRVVETLNCVTRSEVRTLTAATARLTPELTAHLRTLLGP